jgi:hypothetical protein
VVGGRRAGGLERLPPRPQRGQVAAVGRGVLAGQLAQLGDPPGPALELHVHHVVGAERGDHPAAGTAPAVGFELGVPAQLVQRRLGGGQHLDAELLEQRARPEARLGEPGGDLVVDGVAGRRAEPGGDPEDRGERAFQPEPRRRAAEQVPVVREQPPDRPGVGLDRGTGTAGHAEAGDRDALAEQHPGDVVVRHDEQPGRVGERLVVGQQAGIDVAVRRDQRQGGRERVELAGDVSLAGFGREQQV